MTPQLQWLYLDVLYYLELQKWDQAYSILRGVLIITIVLSTPKVMRQDLFTYIQF